MSSSKGREFGWISFRLWLVLLLQLRAFCSEAETNSTTSPDKNSTKSCTGMECRLDAEFNETKCNNPDGWNLKGSEWGCCGNYEGCCTYASFICYLHDAICRCCDTKLCGPACQLEPDCAVDTAESNKEKSEESEKDDQEISEREIDEQAEKGANSEDAETTRSSDMEKTLIGMSTKETDRNNPYSLQYERGQSVQSKGKRVFGQTEDSIEEGSGETEEKTPL